MQGRDADDLATSAKEFVAAVKGSAQSYRVGAKAPDLTLRTAPQLGAVAAALAKGDESLDQLGSSADVMRSHAASVTAASGNLKQVAKTMSQCYHKLFIAWGHVCGAAETPARQ